MIILLLVLTVVKSFCQDFNSAIYDFKLNKDRLISTFDKKDMTSFKKGYFTQMIDAADKSEFILNFIDCQSSFQMREQLSLGDRNINLAKGLLVSLQLENTIYFDSQNKKILKKRGQDDLLHLVELEFGKVKWTIGKNSRKIDNLTCFPAQTTLKLNNFLYTVEVWFAPKISVPFGPSFINGLPGIIVSANFYSEATPLEYSFHLVKLFKDQEIQDINSDIFDLKVLSETDSQSLFENSNLTRTNN